MNNLAAALQTDRTLRTQLLERWPDLAEDETALLDTLDGISDLDEQIVAALRVGLEREAYAEGLAAHIGRLNERRQRLATGAENIRNAVLGVMLEAGRSKIVSPDMTISVSPGRAGVQVIDETLLPAEFVVTTTRADMKAINAAVKAGEAVQGTAPKNPSPYLQIRIK